MAGEPLAPLGSLDDEAGGLEHADVLLHRGERHVVVGRERRHRLLVLDRPAEDVATRRRRERVEEAVDVVIAQLAPLTRPGFVSCNHLVVR